MEPLLQPGAAVERYDLAPRLHGGWVLLQASQHLRYAPDVELRGPIPEFRPWPLQRDHSPDMHLRVLLEWGRGVGLQLCRLLERQLAPHRRTHSQSRFTRNEGEQGLHVLASEC